MTVVECRCHRLDATNHLVGCLSRAGIRRHPEARLRVAGVVIKEISSEPFSGRIGLLPTEFGQRNCMVRQLKMLAFVDVAGGFAVPDEEQSQRGHSSTLSEGGRPHVTGAGVNGSTGIARNSCVREGREEAGPPTSRRSRPQAGHPRTASTAPVILTQPLSGLFAGAAYGGGSLPNERLPSGIGTKNHCKSITYRLENKKSVFQPLFHLLSNRRMHNLRVARCNRSTTRSTTCKTALPRKASPTTLAPSMRTSSPGVGTSPTAHCSSGAGWGSAPSI